MEETLTPMEIKEQIEQMKEFETGWSSYLALSTAIIAVFAALASFQAGNYVDQSLLAKNDATLNQAKASDQWSYYQAKGVKFNIADSFANYTGRPSFKDQANKYAKDQEEIQKSAKEFEAKVIESNDKSEILFEKHHKISLAVTFLQIAVALSAISALLKRKSFWYFSILTTLVGLIFFLIGLMM